MHDVFRFGYQLRSIMTMPLWQAQIRDVSARGISFFIESAVTQGSPIGFTLTLPPEITLTESIRVQCKGRVVRVENGRPDGKLAVAAVIEEYQFLPNA